jgi:DNA-binding response OmpR family regulator
MKKVLIIEDEKDLAELLAFNLEKEGYAATCVNDGKLGLERASSDMPDLILCCRGCWEPRSARRFARTSALPISQSS